MHSPTISSVQIIESLDNEDLQTGSRLRFDLEEMEERVQTPPYVCHVEKTKADVLHRLAAIRSDVEVSRLAPILHLEMHGVFDRSLDTWTGLETASREHLSWEELRDPLSGINGACGLNLVVVCQACSGASIIQTLQTMGEAPFFGCIGPRPGRRPEAGEIRRTNKIFYETLFATKNADEAIKAANALTPDDPKAFIRISAMDIFKWVFSQYILSFTEEATEARTESLMQAAELLRSDATAAGREFPPTSREGLREAISDHRSHFTRFKRRFFFLDRWPLNEERFTVSLSDCEQVAKRMAGMTTAQ